ncbi:arad-like aldolase/epimerase [Mycena albidolilacea]|uniref:Arad-like aldolase/epimerase n=1 Tax=Mycena albidolilacea TaxID=1033008 RepID=A0AAD7EAG6_9AGAR|nr:arad-like aldolase/epimerase [Mycena albidolilacea]
MYSKIFLTGAVLAGLAAADTAVTDSSVSAAIPASVTAAGIDLLDASHILHFLDVVDAYGHVSVRNPANSSQFLMTYAVAPAQATSQSIVTYAIQNATVLNLTFNPSVKGTAVPTSFAERFIHSEIYKKFPDVNAVIHSHTQEVLPFANQASVPFVAQMHTSPSVGSTGAPVFDIRTVATSLLPDSALHDLLVRTAGLGDALAAKFVTGSQVVLMRGHGMAIRADSIRDAVFNAYYTKQDATVQLQSFILGGGKTLPIALNAREITDATTTCKSLVARAWPMWAQQVDIASGLYNNDLRKGAVPAATGY